jgi:hypothetical protein
MEVNQFTVLYFSWEKMSALFFIAIGLMGVATALFFWQKTASEILRLAPYPLAIFGSLSLIVGCTIFFRTETQVSGLLSLVQLDPTSYFSQELERIASVNQNWALYKWGELVVIVASLVVIMIFPNKSALLGMSLAAIMIAVPLLTLDIIGERNGLWYMAQIKSLKASL